MARCPKCGEELAVGNRLGACPKCLVQAGLEELTPTHSFDQSLPGAGEGEDRGSLPSGTRLGPYIIVKPLGSGGMGQVYRARDSRLNRDVALKLMLDKASRDRALQLRFEQEARAAGALNHPNIVSVYDVGYEGPIFYIVSELVDGESLRQVIARGPVPGQKVAIIGAQIAEGIAAAHKAGFVHRDLKPENIMLTPDGRVKILDFGLAKRVHPLMDAAAGPDAAQMTKPGTVMGTVGYMSPEQVRAQGVDHRSDIFSLGAILFELTTGKRAFSGDSPIEILSAILFNEDTSALEAPAAIASAIRRCLEKEPSRRFQDASSLALALKQSEKTPVRWWWAALLVASLGVGGTVWYRTTGHVPAPATTASQQATQPPSGALASQESVAQSPGKGAGNATSKSTPAAQPPTRPIHNEPRPGTVRVNRKDGQRYVWIPPGHFRMGCSPGDADCTTSEKPTHNVTISKGFWAGQTEAAVGAFQKFVDATGRKMPPEPRLLARALNPGWAGELQPIVNVTWEQARDFCAWDGMRLPSEAEWEWAARGGTTGATYGEPNAIGWYAVNSGREPLEDSPDGNDFSSSATFSRLNTNGNALHPVAQKQPNHYGLYDMLGNVWECTADWFGRYQSGEQLDPQGPPSGTSHVVRGGAWGRSSKLARVSYRANTGSGFNIFVGFRCAGQLP
jgi:serine/threonine protein kinase